MKRRRFVRNIASSVMVPVLSGTGAPTTYAKYDYPAIDSLDDLRNEEGLVAIRIMIEAKPKISGERLIGRIRLRGGSISRIRDFFSLGENRIDPDKHHFNLDPDPDVSHILACWLENAREDSELVIRSDRESYRFLLSEILAAPEAVREDDRIKITVSGLPYHEVGTIDAEDLGIPADQNDFRFVIMADPQGGDPDDSSNASPTRIRIHNAFIEETIDLANNLDPASLFTLVLGDFTDSQGEERNFERMIGFYEKLKQPILLEIGNHETRYRSVFTPGYNMSAFNNYFAAQKKINGLEKLLYSFDVGNWHFVVWPDPLRSNFWETHPHYFDWLEQDLETNRDKPVFFFQHVPMHPIGINPLVSYVNPVHINRLMYGILTKHDNVRYVFSGHVHIPLRASVRTAVNFKSMRMINLPPAGYRPRAFGEEDLFGGPSQGICIVDVSGDKSRVSFRTVTGREYTYEPEFREFSAGQDPLWFRYKWELEGNEGILNGSFEEGMDHWLQQFVYPEEHNPSNLREIRESPDRQGKSLYLFSKKRGYDAPGQDRLPQSLNQVTQVIRVPSQRQPILKFRFRIDGAHYHPDTWNGAFLWVESYRGRHLASSLVYVIGRGSYSIAGSYGRQVKSSWFDLNDTPDRWHEAVINISDDYRKTNGDSSLAGSGIDKYAISFGTWTINDGFNQEIGLFINDVMVEFVFPDDTGNSRLDDKPIGLLDEDKIFAARIRHEAGEHQYATQEELYPY